MNQGRCSNAPSACPLAAARTLQPWAGPDSVCAECGAPLARVAAGAAPAYTPAPPPPPPASPPAYTHTPAASYPDRGWSGGSPDAEEEADPTRGGNGALVLGIVVLGVLVAGFLILRALSSQPDGTPAPGDFVGPGAAETATTAQVTPVSPAELRRVASAVEVLAAPDAAASVVGRLGANATVDVTGRATNGTDRWARVVIPGAAGRTGFVREQVLVPLGDGMVLEAGPALPPARVPDSPAAGAGTGPLSGLPIPDGMAGTTVGDPLQPAAPAAGPVQPMAPTVVYIASRRANLRATASADSARIGEAVFGDTLVVTGQRMMGPRLWYEVQMPDGGTGWINAGLVSANRPSTPIDARPVTPSTPDQGAAPPLPPGAGEAQRDTRPRAVPPRTVESGPFVRGAAVSVQTPQANVRAEPSTSADVIDRVEFGDGLKIEQVTRSDGRVWLRITTRNGVTGWLSSSTVAPL